MRFDLEDLTYEQLLELRHKIDTRLEQLQGESAKDAGGVFRPGDRVRFSHPAFGRVEGTLLAVTQRTVTVVGDSGQTWEVSSRLLRKLILGGGQKGGLVRPLKRT
jgi:hypothetical protein